jgi:hypothetical protein
MRTRPMEKERRASLPSAKTTAARLVGALALVATAAACGTTAGSPPATSTTSTVAGGKHVVLSVAAIRKLYLADSAASNAAFTAFTTDYSSSNNADGGLTVATPAEARDATKTAKTLRKSALQIATLESEAPTKIATDLRSLLVAENVVFQGLLDLAADYTSRSFDFAGWENSFGEAAVSTDQAATAVAKDLGIPLDFGNTGATGTSG